IEDGVYTVKLDDGDSLDTNNKGSLQKSKDINSPADFETAVSATDFGLFNILMLLVALPCAASSVFDTTTLAFVAPDAECDLGLTLMDKGLMNAIVYVGMILSAFLWGYLADTLGRRKLMVLGYLLDAVCVFASAFSQSTTALMIAKFFGGFIICGPFAVLMSYLSEFHGATHRSRVVLCVGMYFSLANITLPGMAWAIIPTRWVLMLPNGSELHSWQIFLAFCSLPSFLSGIFMWMLPESPKFLMSRGRNEEALEVFKKVYRINHWNDKTEYPIKQLVEETKANGQDGSPKPEGMEALKAGFKQFKPLFYAPHLKNCIIVCAIQLLALLGLNTLRLWLPQMFSMMEEYDANPSKNDTSLCSILGTTLNQTKYTQDVFDVNAPCTVTTEYSMYINSTIVGIVSFCGYLIAGALINAVGNRNISMFGFFLAGSCGMALYYAWTPIIAVALSAVYCAISGISTTALIGIVVVLFPTDLRTMAVSLLMMIGRVGAVFGNVVFPLLLESGCFAPFFTLGIVIFVCGLLCLLLPKTSKKPLQ
ncbi:synaptic vesicle glycoprotein 2B-like, partial [Ctenocephalides felis]|uniref:synaptic vesicle glycoprotein 2B-like n=1 Tax=Ctenocephalides felis TaxID=7515 RepID=UPI000E6E2B8D